MVNDDSTGGRVKERLFQEGMLYKIHKPSHKFLSCIKDQYFLKLISHFRSYGTNCGPKFHG
jgi:hypothetical protein